MPKLYVANSQAMNTVRFRAPNPVSSRERTFLVVVVSSSHQSLILGVSRFRSAQSITILLLVWSASKNGRKGGGCHEANDRSCGNGCALSGLECSCSDHALGRDMCAVVPVLFLSSLAVSVRLWQWAAVGH